MDARIQERHRRLWYTTPAGSGTQRNRTQRNAVSPPFATGTFTRSGSFAPSSDALRTLCCKLCCHAHSELYVHPSLQATHLRRPSAAEWNLPPNNRLIRIRKAFSAYLCSLVRRPRTQSTRTNNADDQWMTSYKIRADP